MLKKILIGIVVVIAGIAILAGLQPSKYHVERQITISAPAVVVFNQVNDLHRWNAWSPWVKMDPNAKETFEGPSSGTGSKFSWAGNMEVGEGSMIITESKPSELVRLNLQFVKPLKGKADVEFTFKSEGNQTVVTWGISGKKRYSAKLIGLIMNCDKMIGEQYEKGLASLKAVSEIAAK